MLPALDGIVDRLTDGIDVADIGCGAGGAVLLMAAAFPQSRFVGYDISRYALDRAGHRLEESGLTNVRFVDPRDEPLPDRRLLPVHHHLRLHPRHDRSRSA